MSAGTPFCEQCGAFAPHSLNDVSFCREAAEVHHAMRDGLVMAGQFGWFNFSPFESLGAIFGEHLVPLSKGRRAVPVDVLSDLCSSEDYLRSLVDATLVLCPVDDYVTAVADNYGPNRTMVRDLSIRHLRRSLATQQLLQTHRIAQRVLRGESLGPAMHAEHKSFYDAFIRQILETARTMRPVLTIRPTDSTTAWLRVRLECPAPGDGWHYEEFLGTDSRRCEYVPSKYSLQFDEEHGYAARDPDLSAAAPSVLRVHQFVHADRAWNLHI